MGWKDKKFGLLEILYSPKPDVFLCRCKCDRQVTLWRSQLANNVVRHCGCRRKFKVPVEQLHFRSARVKNRKWPKKFSTAELNSFMAMRDRCYLESKPEYPNYGGRGIRVCDRWLEYQPKGFLNFLADMGPRPSGMTLDRINPQGHYSPDNCRWATPKEQRWNQRRLVFKDKEMPPVESPCAMNARVDAAFVNESEAAF